MQTLIFTSGVELPILGCSGQIEYFQGAQRDVLDFRLDPASNTLDEVDELFTSENCSTLTIRETITELVTVEQEVTLEDGTTETQTVPQEVSRTKEGIHHNYALRVSLVKREFDIPKPDGTVGRQEMISVKMAQRSYLEMQVDEVLASRDVYDEMAAAYQEGVEQA